MNKNLVGYPLAVILSLGIGSGAASIAAETPDPVVKTKTVTEAPSECGTVINALADLLEAVGKENSTMGRALDKVSTDADTDALGASISDATTTMSDFLDEIGPTLKPATDACGAAVPL
ncbi:MAG TPA: hypothetical protein VFC57_02320 [Aeromicrobium sp.]|nr:hypothetical protein [Aeromicrobium sp.]